MCATTVYLRRSLLPRSHSPHAGASLRLSLFLLAFHAIPSAEQYSCRRSFWPPLHPLSHRMCMTCILPRPISTCSGIPSSARLYIPSHKDHRGQTSYIAGARNAADISPLYVLLSVEHSIVTLAVPLCTANAKVSPHHPILPMHRISTTATAVRSIYSGFNDKQHVRVFRN
jgi:hypothetical protein